MLAGLLTCFGLHQPSHFACDKTVVCMSVYVQTFYETYSYGYSSRFSRDSLFILPKKGISSKNQIQHKGIFLFFNMQ